MLKLAKPGVPKLRTRIVVFFTVLLVISAVVILWFAALVVYRLFRGQA